MLTCAHTYEPMNCDLCLKACANNLREILVLVVLAPAPSRLKFTLLKQFVSREKERKLLYTYFCYVRILSKQVHKICIFLCYERDFHYIFNNKFCIFSKLIYWFVISCSWDYEITSKNKKIFEIDPYFKIYYSNSYFKIYIFCVDFSSNKYDKVVFFYNLYTFMLCIYILIFEQV